MKISPECDRGTESNFYYRFNRFLERRLPSGLYQRSLIILVAPMILLQTIMAGFILERHWDNVTKVLGRSLSREIGLLITLYDQSDHSQSAMRAVERMALERLALDLVIMRDATLPEPKSSVLFSLVNNKLSKYLIRETGRPFWIDSSGAGFVDIRVEVSAGVVFRLLVDDDRTYATSTYTLLLWMLGSSFVLLAIAVIFMRKQIRPIVLLAQAAQNFGRGQDISKFEPRGAREVRQAGFAFLDMKKRIERHVEQRTAMLAGVSHDLRTILTRFQLELAVLGGGPKIKPLKEDAKEMQSILEAYMEFVRGSSGEKAKRVKIAGILQEIARRAKRSDRTISVSVLPRLSAILKPNAFRRLINNLVDNAVRHGTHIFINAEDKGNMLVINIDDDGPGIDASSYEEAFRPFVRLDEARNLDETGTGLGLAIARDIARAHGGDIALLASPRGGLRAQVAIPM